MLYRLAVPRTRGSGRGERTKARSRPGTCDVRRSEGLSVSTNCSETQCVCLCIETGKSIAIFNLLKPTGYVHQHV